MNVDLREFWAHECRSWLNLNQWLASLINLDLIWVTILCFLSGCSLYLVATYRLLLFCWYSPRHVLQKEEVVSYHEFARWPRTVSVSTRVEWTGHYSYRWWPQWWRTQCWRSCSLCERNIRMGHRTRTCFPRQVRPLQIEDARRCCACVCM